VTETLAAYVAQTTLNKSNSSLSSSRNWEVLPRAVSYRRGSKEASQKDHQEIVTNRVSLTK